MPKITQDKRRKSPEQHEAVAAAICNGDSIQSALLKGGYSENVARMGRKSLTQPVLDAIMKRGFSFAKNGQEAHS